MSMNLYVRAHGTVTTPNGKLLKYQQNFDLPQTSTAETKFVINSEDGLAAYKSMVRYHSFVPKLEKWIEKMKDLGFEIEWYKT